jgi:hypothetical protein
MEKKIKTSRVLIGGLLTGLILNVIDAPNGVLVTGPMMSEYLQSLGIVPNPLVVAFFFPYHLIYGIMIVWSYAAFIPTLGATRKNAIIATSLFLVTTRFMAFGFVVMGLFPLKLYLLFSSTMIVGSLVGGIVGCWFYSRRINVAGSIYN